jgi:hypothetical protein
MHATYVAAYRRYLNDVKTDKNAKKPAKPKIPQDYWDVISGKDDKDRPDETSDDEFHAADASEESDDDIDSDEDASED